MNTANELFQCAPESIPSVWNWQALQSGAQWAFAEFGLGLAGAELSTVDDESRWLGIG
jgi:hypothetical protein